MKRLLPFVLIGIFASIDTVQADVCDTANSTVAKVTAGAAAATAVTGGTLSTLGITAVGHAAGGTILTGAGGYLAGTLGTLGASALGVVTAPVTIVAASVTAVAVGGTLVYCHYNAPATKPKAAPKATPPIKKSAPPAKSDK